MTALTVTPADADDAAEVATVLGDDWADTVVVHGTVYRPAELPALLARDAGGAPVGVLTYHVDGDALEVVTLDARPPRRGAGSALLAAAEQEARRQGLHRMWLVTTNDNLDAARFYQRRGMRLAAVTSDAVATARRLKPSIPDIGGYGIPVRDELVFVRDIVPADVAAGLPDGYRLVDGPPPVDDYVRLRERAGLAPVTHRQAAAALPGGWAACHVVHDPTGAAVGMGRVLGDGGWYFHVVDMAVLPEHQRRGLGDAVLTRLLARIRSQAPPGAYVNLLADPPGRGLYARHGFRTTAPDTVGMALRLT